MLGSGRPQALGSSYDTTLTSLLSWPLCFGVVVCKIQVPDQMLSQGLGLQRLMSLQTREHSHLWSK